MNETAVLNENSEVGVIVARYPLAARVFSRLNIDYCCGGGVALEKACLKKKLDVKAVLKSLLSEIQENENTDTDWTKAPLDQLIFHILETYHEPLKEEFIRLENMLQKVLRVHGEEHFELFSGMQQLFLDIKDELTLHMQKEEQVLFPMILKGHGTHADGPIACMKIEHEETGKHLEDMKKLTENYVPAAYACNTWRALFAGLHDMERALHEHIHLENNILFPRALKGA